MGAPKLKSNVGAIAITSDEKKVLTYDANPFWQSTLFSDVYLRNDVPTKYKDVWELEEAGAFHQFCEQFRNLCEELKDADVNSWSERTTINRFIKPVLKLLGYANHCSVNQEPWTEDESFSIKEQGETRTYKPDLIIVNDPKELKYIERKSGDEKLQEARSSVILTIEAKYWGRIDEARFTKKEDKQRADKKNGGDRNGAREFDEQCLKYIEVLKNDYGILTDGKTWRLYHKDLSSDSFRRFYQFNLGRLIKHVQAGLDRDVSDYEIFTENAKYFFHFFSKSALHNESGGRRFLDDLVEDSKKYASTIDENLKNRFVSAMAIACNGFRLALGHRFNSASVDLIRGVSESLIFNTFFLRFCETRNILPIRQNPEYRKVSLSNMIDKLEMYDPEKEEDDLNLAVLQRLFKNDFAYRHDGNELYTRLLSLAQIVQDGTNHPAAKFAISGFRETVFSDEEKSFTDKYRLSNRAVVRLLFELTYTESSVKGKRFQQIAYSFFAPRQLGSIYESFLEYRLDLAQEDMAFIKGQWAPANLQSEKLRKLSVPKIGKGELFFTPDNKERKATGTYYTPEYVVRYIVESAIAPQIEQLTSKQLLKHRICDPAMGSGHFLSATLNFLARKYLEKLESETNDDINVGLLEAKHSVLSACVFGVDLNPRAVKLTKMSLWLESAHAGHRLEKLDDQIKVADTLGDDFNWKTEFPEVFEAGGFDAIIGNPPYRRELDFKDQFDKIAATSIGRKYKSPRMDLWYYFVHRGIELLREDGSLSFITNAYWVAGSGAEKLIQHISVTCSVREIVFLRDLKLFDAVSGQHMVFRLSKGAEESRTIIKVAPEEVTSAIDLFNGTKSFLIYKKERAALFRNGKVDLEESADEILSLIEKGTPLRDLGLIRQGIAENPATIGKKVNQKFKNRWTTGEGVFSLTPKELKDLSLDDKESNLCRPYHDLCDISWHWCADVPSRRIIYSTKDTVPNIDHHKSLKVHLAKFKALMDGRRETINGSNQWWHLHWPRDEKVWESSQKILSVQMGKRPTFASIKGPCYVPFSVNVFVPSDESRVALEYYEGILNSALLWKWFTHNAKKRGVGLEINGNVLQRAPILIVDRRKKDGAALHDKLVAAVKDLKEAVKKARQKGLNGEDGHDAVAALARHVDEVVFKIYGVPNEMATGILKLLQLANDSNQPSKVA